MGLSLAGIPIPDGPGEPVVLAATGVRFDQVTLVAMGSRGDRTAERIRRVGGSIARLIGARRLADAVIDMTDVVDALDDAVFSFCEGLELGSFRFDGYKSQADKIPNTRVVCAFAGGAGNAAKQMRNAHTVAAATNDARTLAHEPANVINPVTLAARARSLAKSAGLKCTVLDERQILKLKMGAMHAVGRASATPPRLIVLEYGARGSAKPVVLIGKAITFDTGGYSLKDKSGIVGMKYDKCGGVAVLGIMKAVAALKPKVPVVGIIASAENMIGGNAYRPNDIITSMSGKTIEIISTDAEGRLVLADALTYAQKRYKPRAMIDIATLTGGVVVALGKVYAGAFCNDDTLRDRLIRSGERTHERLWSLPMHDEFFELIRGDDCDMKNSATREGHASVGAVFLKQFVDPKIPWAHLDIAAVGSIDKPTPYCPKGGTGFGVRLLCDYLTHL